MAADQRNFQNFTYTDDNAVDWTKRGEDDTVRAAVDGSSASIGAPVWKDGARYHVRSVIYQDPTTFRTKKVIVYTAAAYAAIALGSTLNFHVEGETAAVAYLAVKKNPEKQPGRGASRQLADHA
jgi:hypothetical protein